MDLQNKIVLAHKGFFNKESQKNYKENSKEVCAISGGKDYIGIIELDVRKSKDGILYCRHGGFWEYYFYHKKSRNFSEIKKKFDADILKEILEVIPENKIICLDLKSKSITKEDILYVIGNKKFREIIIADTTASPDSMDHFNDMPKNFVKAMNGHIFCNFYDLKKLKDRNYKYFEVVFPFQATKKVKEKVEKSGLEFRCAGLFFLNKRSYWNKIEKLGIKHVSSDFI